MRKKFQFPFSSPKNKLKKYSKSISNIVSIIIYPFFLYTSRDIKRGEENILQSQRYAVEDEKR